MNTVSSFNSLPDKGSKAKATEYRIIQEPRACGTGCSTGEAFGVRPRCIGTLSACSRAAFLLPLFLNLLCAHAADQPKNSFANPSFELGHEGWNLAKAGKTESQFAVVDQDAAEGRHSALLTIGATVESWGVQFGQDFAAGQKGKTYTFAVFAKAESGPVSIGLEIERTASPWDRAASQKFTLTTNWQELHTTFQVEKDFSQGWFAYVSCAQPQSRLRLDMFRLYEGSYVPYKESIPAEAAAPMIRLFDANHPTSVPLTPEAMAARAGWAEVPEDDLSHRFQGAAVFMNGTVAVVMRPGAPGVEVYSLAPEGPALRGVLAPASGAAGATLSSFAIIQNNAGAGVADVSFKTAGDGRVLTLRYGLRPGEPILETEPRTGVTALRIEAPCRFAVLPDFFADDIVVDASELPVREAELPGDNLLLHLLPDRRAILMAVTKTTEEDVRVTLAGEGTQRKITSSELRYGKDGKIWIAVLVAQNIWHAQDIARQQAGQIVRLDWQAPFPAQWRTDWRREKGLTDSWEMMSQRADGQFVRYGIFGGPETVPANRRRWTTVLGEFKYPCWLETDGRGFLQPLAHPALRFEGPAVIYPLNRAPATALTTFTVTDIMRNTLGVGPCEYVLDVENQKSQYKGRATCSVRDTLNPIYTRHEQKQRRADIERTLEELMVFVRHIRDRIEGYVTFGHETLAYLAEQKKAHPELAGPLGELEDMVRTIDVRYAARKKEIKTPEVAAGMVEEFNKTVLDYEGDDALARCRRFTEGWVEIGGNQDELAGECRWAVKMIRQKAGLLTATDPRLAEIGKELRRRSQIILRNPASHEGARH